MGRKKIEIRPLTTIHPERAADGKDERNRNVTFLKRKAGLMKKAWELSVLCGAEVSILIFNNAGKPFEFSSRDLDSEIDRYLEYEGLIERRRGEEFAAMAEAGEDDEDDDEDGDGPSGRKNSKAGVAGSVNGQNAANGQKPVKSLKGKESFKKRMYSRRDLARGASKRKRGGDRDGKQGFIDGLLSSDDEGLSPGGSSDGLAYALNMHQHPAFASSLPYPASLGGGVGAGGSSNMRGSSSSLKPDFGLAGSGAGYTSSSYPPMGNLPSGALPQGLGSQFSALSSLGGMSALPPNMGGLQWDANLAARYAEFQLQQNHQRQQRILLERQRAQLAELGVDMGSGAERRLLDDVFGLGRGGAGTSSGHHQNHHHQAPSAQSQSHHAAGGGSAGSHHTPASHGGMSIDSNGPPPGSNSVGAGAGADAEFIWPTFSSTGASSSAGGPSVPQASGGGGGETSDGRGYYTTPESYDPNQAAAHAHVQSHGQVQLQEQWAAQQIQSMAYSASQDDGQAQGPGAQFTSPMSYDDERRRREDLYGQGQVPMSSQNQGQGQMMHGHHEKRVRVI